MALEYIDPPFPYIKDVLQGLEKELDEALWNDDSTLAKQIKNTIETYKIKLKLGEEYVVPF